jgi:hypothetical protein
MSGYCAPPSTTELAALLAAARARLAALSEVEASGVRRVTHGDKTTEFRPAAEISTAIAAQRREIARLEGLLGCAPRPAVRRVLTIGSKGL